ncbi:UDP-N-acetylmuramoyl-L-alanine--D-glutamate ligase [Corynebacterium ulcerans]|uniref:UDP-N-acetylmuramoylalanine--D-glutamate ligase n=1 Tax=Corynebacterium ulcerans TaxID=65058 RepID=A0ABD0BHI3_CORUL|nr:UDP-N-acetylmuramoyl-L-alanine--D-glutamate ligase [Corynebacterium ulcerans]BAM27831.1 UDP-N-acetylmuramoyl-L-alanyl-D-glutamate synthetase [Corynebacterium ulcerans 0102]BBJ72473.1 UDP-N-acetylmuramoyl-L-alanyl-D-glutamate synthetase [Corynebacterium ulcerans]BBJ74778.1 UDP-N-acetylmuramoyl-L-alanyl-D-glutamate synthetase [Corynebacterium ulcerans]GJJ33862.1 UDP-N-acetylmuramoyl-L-alanyl-D-glutamate synthetase [Corynebacterium ulcerans]GJJ36601.1 UDP-N-acetylmuramoyl-L-alanyl-D-glutamate 
MKRLPQELQGRVLVAGAGLSGLGIAALLKSLDVDVVVTDSRPEALENIHMQTGAEVCIDANIQVEDFTSVITSPGWKPDTPLLVRAQDLGIEVLGDVELAYRLDRAEVFGKPRQWLVVTGTNGKTTTTAMLEAIMKRAGVKAHAVGNIGVSVAEALSSAERIDVFVAELSSFQLHWSEQLIPDVGILLNLADDHIDWHGSFDSYAAAKAKVLRAPIAIAGVDNEHVARLLSTTQTQKLVEFTAADPCAGQLGVRNKMIVDCAFADSLELVSAEGIEPSGPAGVYDALAAAAAARAMGVSADTIAAALADFHVAGHRGQVVGNARGIVAIDNSKATNPHAAGTALAGHESIVWVAGGQLKGAEIRDLVLEHSPRLKAVALLGIDAPIIAETVRELAPHAAIMVTENQEPREAMNDVVAWSVAHAAPGDAIILAPAAASLDMYSGMGQRGDIFAEAIARELHD